MNRYQNIKVLNLNEDNGKKGKRYYKGVKYPEIPESENDLYVITNQEDRYDLLAQVYYKDSGLWWIFPAANPSLPLDSIFIPVGTQLRIPIEINLILSNYFKLNNL